MGLLGVIWKRRPQACLPEMVRILKKVPVWMTERVKIAEMFLSSWIYNRELIPIQRQNNKALAIPSPKVALGISFLCRKLPAGRDWLPASAGRHRILSLWAPLLARDACSLGSAPVSLPWVV